MITIKDTHATRFRTLIGGCLGCCMILAVALVLLLIAGVFAIPQVRQMAIADSTTVGLPDGRGELQFARIRVHPIASEYSRTVTLNGGVKHPLPLNTGWKTNVNLYWVEDGNNRFLRLVDLSGECLLNIGADKMMLLVTASDGGRVFAGELKSETPRVRGFEPMGDPSAAKAWVDDVPAQPIETIVKDLEGIFLGSIRGTSDHLRFYIPSEQPEYSIRPASAR